MLMQFIWGLGVLEEEVEFNDVYGLDEELLEMVPKPVFAVMFLFPYATQVIPLINAMHAHFVNYLLHIIFSCYLVLSISLSKS